MVQGYLKYVKLAVSGSLWIIILFHLQSIWNFKRISTQKGKKKIYHYSIILFITKETGSSTLL